MDIIIACIGTTSVVGDSLGPRVGDLLIKDNINAYVYGTYLRPITAKTIQDYNTFIKKYHPNSLVIAVDACLGKESNIGTIHYVKNAITPGKALNDNAFGFGDCGFLAVVGKHTSSPITELSSVSEKYIQKLAEKTSEMVKQALTSIACI